MSFGRSELALQKIDQKISDITDQCSDTLVDQRALLAGQAVVNNIDLTKYRQIILKEMEEKKNKRLAMDQERATRPVVQSSRIIGIYFICTFKILEILIILFSK